MSSENQVGFSPGSGLYFFSVLVNFFSGFIISLSSGSDFLYFQDLFSNVSEGFRPEKFQQGFVFFSGFSISFPFLGLLSYPGSDHLPFF